MVLEQLASMSLETWQSCVNIRDFNQSSCPVCVFQVALQAESLRLDENTRSAC